MKRGLFVAPTINEYSDPRNLVELAKMAEQAGWDGYFICDHLLLDPEGFLGLADPTIVLGAIAADVNYIGTDPCTKTFEGLEEIKRDWGGLNRTIELHKLGSEDFRPDKNSIDLCFTSPPYYDWEKYSDEDTQSYIKYPTKEEWIEGFLRQTIENCYYGLKSGGTLIMNVANTKRIKNFETETTRLAMQAGFAYMDTWYLQLSTQLKGEVGNVKRESIFIFKKQ